MTNNKTAYADIYRNVDFRKHPEKYRIGRGKQGVLIAEPYKSEVLPHWRFKSPEIAKSEKIFYEVYVKAKGNPYYLELKENHKNLTKDLL